MEYKLNNNLCLKYIENIKIDSIDYYKYSVVDLETESIICDNLYFSKQINLNEVAKDKLSNYIIEKINSSNEENIFVDLEQFMIIDNNSSSDFSLIESKASNILTVILFHDESYIFISLYWNI